MDAKKMAALYHELVASKMENTIGAVKLPIAAMQELHDKSGMMPEQMCYYCIRLPSAEDGKSRYVIGEDSADDATVTINSEYYYDPETEDGEAIPQNHLLERVAYQIFYDRGALFSGDLRVDHLGRLWMIGLTEENIGVEFVVQFQNESIGYELRSEDNKYRYRVWCDGKSFFLAPGSTHRAGVLPS